jgi:hypothetical protein
MFRQPDRRILFCAGDILAPFLAALRVSAQDSVCDFLGIHESCWRGRVLDPTLSSISLGLAGTSGGTLAGGLGR